MNEKLQSTYGQVTGLGSAKEGTTHWLVQRISAVALIPLSLWFVISVANMENYTHHDVLIWLSRPITTILMLLYIPTALYHGYLGIKVILEDYVHNEGTKIGCIIAAKFIFIPAGVMAVWAILKVSFS